MFLPRQKGHLLASEFRIYSKCQEAESQKDSENTHFPLLCEEIDSKACKNSAIYRTEESWKILPLGGSDLFRKSWHHSQLLLWVVNLRNTLENQPITLKVKVHPKILTQVPCFHIYCIFDSTLMYQNYLGRIKEVRVIPQPLQNTP